MPESSRSHWSRFIASLALVLAGVSAGGVGLPACGDHLDCEEADQQARALLAEYGSCANGETCRAFDAPAKLKGREPHGICLDAFVCPIALPETADQRAFIERAQDLLDRRRCTTCSLAKCQLPDRQEPMCDPETKRCRLRPTGTP